MRKGRFAGLSDKGQEAVTPPELAELLLFDFTPAADEDDHRAARERARTVQLSLPLLGGSHALWSAVLIGGLAASGATGGILGLTGLLVAILLLDLALGTLCAPRLAGLLALLARFCSRAAVAVATITITILRHRRHRHAARKQDSQNQFTHSKTPDETIALCPRIFEPGRLADAE